MSVLLGLISETLKALFGFLLLSQDRNKFVEKLIFKKELKLFVWSEWFRCI